MVAVYDAPAETVTVGAAQVLFERDKAQLVKRIPAHRFAFADPEKAPESRPRFDFAYGEVAPF